LNFNLNLSLTVGFGCGRIELLKEKSNLDVFTATAGLIVTRNLVGPHFTLIGQNLLEICFSKEFNDNGCFRLPCFAGEAIEVNVHSLETDKSKLKQAFLGAGARLQTDRGEIKVVDLDLEAFLRPSLNIEIHQSPTQTESTVSSPHMPTGTFYSANITLVALL